MDLVPYSEPVGRFFNLVPLDEITELVKGQGVGKTHFNRTCYFLPIRPEDYGVLSSLDEITETPKSKQARRELYLEAYAGVGSLVAFFSQAEVLLEFWEASRDIRHHFKNKDITSYLKELEDQADCLLSELTSKAMHPINIDTWKKICDFSEAYNSWSLEKGKTMSREDKWDFIAGEIDGGFVVNYETYSTFEELANFLSGMYQSTYMHEDFLPIINLRVADLKIRYGCANLCLPVDYTRLPNLKKHQYVESLRPMKLTIEGDFSSKKNQHLTHYGSFLDTLFTTLKKNFDHKEIKRDGQIISVYCPRVNLFKDQGNLLN